MKNYTITKEFGITKAQAEIKERVRACIMNALATEFETENVKIARIENKTSGTNEIAVRTAIITENGFEYEQCVTIPITMKTYKEKVTSKYTVEPFDFETATANYTKWVAEKEAEAKQKAEAKEKEIARSKARREAQKKANEEVKKAVEEI